MKKNKKNLAGHDDSVYPGSYVSPLNNKKIINEINNCAGQTADHFPVNVTDSADTFKIEIAIPGIKKEEFLITAKKNSISVIVAHKNEISNESPDSSSHQLGSICFEKHFVLPQNVDPEYLSAEYTEGILCLHLSKTKQPARQPNTQILVY